MPKCDLNKVALPLRTAACVISHCVFPQNTYTRKVREITVFYAVFAKNWFSFGKNKTYKNMG